MEIYSEEEKQRVAEFSGIRRTPKGEHRYAGDNGKSMLRAKQFVPVEYKVWILVDEVSEKEGSLWLPETTIDRQQEQRDTGTLIKASEMAFSDWNGRKPEIGEKVVFSKYAGSIFRFPKVEGIGVDRYRLCNDKDICAVIEEEK